MQNRQRFPGNPLLLAARLAFERGELPWKAYQAFCNHVYSAKRRGIDFLFTIETWWAWWQTDDRWALRGRGRDRIVMARHGDVGPYAPDNVSALTPHGNANDRPKDARRASAAKGWETDRVCHLAVRGDGHPKSRAIITPDQRFGSAALAAEHYGITRQGAAQRARIGTGGWRYE